MWEFIDITFPKAAKPHACEECQAVIPVGERHSHTSGKVEGDLTSYRLCMKCHRLAQAYCQEINDEGFPLPGLRDAIAEEGISDVEAWLADAETKAEERRMRTASYARRSEILSEHVICERCGATIATWARTCAVAISDVCAGSLAIGAAISSKAS